MSHNIKGAKAQNVFAEAELQKKRIAALPDLIDALQHAHNFITSNHGYDHQTVRRISAALAKAGEL